MVWSYEPDEASTSLAIKALVASLPDGSSMRLTVKFWSLKYPSASVSLFGR